MARKKQVFPNSTTIRVSRTCHAAVKAVASQRRAEIQDVIHAAVGLFASLSVEEQRAHIERPGLNGKAVSS